MDRAQLKEVLHFEESDRFSDREKALLSYVKEVTLTKNSSDTVFDRLRQYFSDKEIVEITWVNASENYFNLLAKPMGLDSDNLKEKTGQHAAAPMTIASERASVSA